MSAVEWPPPRLDYIWRWFNQLSGWRQIGMSLGAISHVEIATWAKLMRFRISPAEVECIRQIDMAYVTYVHEKNTPRKPSITEQMQGIKDHQDGERINLERRKAEVLKKATKIDG